MGPMGGFGGRGTQAPPQMTQGMPGMTQYMGGMTQRGGGGGLLLPTQGLTLGMGLGLGPGLGGVGGGSVARAHSFGGSHANDAAVASEMTARAAIAALLALGRTFPAAAAAAAARLLERITEPVELEEEDDDENIDKGDGVSVKSGLEGVADSAVSVMCSLAGVDAADEVLDDGTAGAGAAGLAKAAIMGLEAVFDNDPTTG